MTIEGKHGLDDEQTLNPSSKWSTYSYLFVDLADEEESGCFPDTDDEVTLGRLIKFADDFCPSMDDLSLSGLLIPVPAAFTYFGQFMNHDLSAPKRKAAGDPPAGIIGTLDPASLTKGWRAKNVRAIIDHFINQHEQPLTLYSLYSDGPERGNEAVRALYNPDKTFVLGKTIKLPKEFFEENKKDPDSIIHATDAPDIPRWPKGRVDGEPSAGNAALSSPTDDRKPLIADQRNDGNLILSQLHLAFMLCHNKAIRLLTKSGTPAGKVFEEARQLVTLHYQWLILNDYLPALLSKTVIDQPMSQWGAPDLPSYEAGSVPMEFTTAAFRFGHSMVGRVYDYNANFGKNGRFGPHATLRDLFNFTSHGDMGNPVNPPLQLPDHWVIDWERLTRSTPADAAQSGAPGQAEGIDFDIAPGMFDDASNVQIDRHGSILFRNLVRGFQRRIPFGQRLAMACWGKDHKTLSSIDILDALTERRKPEAVRERLRATAKELGFDENTPAWLYFLCEAKVIEKGKRVGPTASKIIAASIIRILRQNKDSVLNYKGGGWKPSQSPLKNRAGEPLDSIRAFLLFATEGAPTVPD